LSALLFLNLEPDYVGIDLFAGSATDAPGSFRDLSGICRVSPLDFGIIGIDPGPPPRGALVFRVAQFQIGRRDP
jgi:hypothetical protein